MKKWFLFMSLMLVLGVLGACGNKETGPDTDKGNSGNQEVSLEDIFQQTKDTMAADLKEDGVEEPLMDGKLASYFEINLTDKDNQDREFYLEKLGITEDQLEAGYVIAAMMNVNADEIIMLEAKDETAVAALKAALEKELSAQTQTWEQYLPDQFDKVKNNVIKQNGNKLMYITYDQPEKIAEIFDVKTK